MSHIVYVASCQGRNKRKCELEGIFKAISDEELKVSAPAPHPVYFLEPALTVRICRQQAEVSSRAMSTPGFNTSIQAIAVRCQLA